MIFDREKTVQELKDMVTQIREDRERDLYRLVQGISARREHDLHVLGKAITLLEEGVARRTSEARQEGVGGRSPTASAAPTDERSERGGAVKPMSLDP